MESMLNLAKAMLNQDTCRAQLRTGLKEIQQILTIWQPHFAAFVI